MYQPNDPVGKTLELSAKLFAIMADEVLAACGEQEGSELVRRAVRRYANLRAEGVKERIRAAGKEVTFETVDEFSDFPPNQAWDCEAEATESRLWELNRVCPFATAFREVGLEKAGSLYCQEIDIALNEAFFGDIQFERPQLFTDGPNAPCEMVVTLASK